MLSYPNISGWTFGYKPEATTTMMQRMSESSTLRCVGMALTLSEGWIVPDDVKLWGLGVRERHASTSCYTPADHGVNRFGIVEVISPEDFLTKELCSRRNC